MILSALCVQADWVSVSVDEVIPDGNSVGIVSTIDLRDAGLNPSLASIEVALHISDVPGDLDYANGGDFYAYLTSGNGGFAVLLNRIGKTEANSVGSDVNGFDVGFSLTGSDIHTLDGSAALDDEGRLTGEWGADGRYVDPYLVVDTDSRTAGFDSFVGIDPNTEWTLFLADVSTGGFAQLDSWAINIAIIPEPTSIGMMGLVVALALLIRRRFLS